MATISSGQSVTVGPGQTANGDVVLSGGTLIANQGSALNTQVSGGTIIAGGTAAELVGTVVSGGSVLVNNDIGIEGDNSFASGSTGGIINFNLNGVGGATEALAPPTNITSGNEFIVGQGAIVSGATAGPGGLIVENGVTASLTSSVISGGTIVIEGNNSIEGLNSFASGSTGGTAIIAIGSGGSPKQYATFTNITSGNVEIVGPNALVSAAVVGVGGTMIVQSGGTINGTTTVDSGGTLTLQGSNGTGVIDMAGASGITSDTSQLAILAVSGSPTNVVSNFGSGDGINFANIAYAGGSVTGSGSTTIDGITINDSGDTLTITSGGVTQTLDVTGVGSSGWTIFSDNGTLLFEVCFAEGTLIATPAGEVAVERLAVGDLVQTLEGPKPVKWLGHRKVDVNTLRNPDAGRLVRVRRGAFGEGVPHTDLLITQEHSVFVDGVFIPVRLLLNGGSIQRDRFIDRYTYYHVELEQHGVLLANGLTTESYLDTGNRAQFQNVPVTGLRTYGFDAAVDVANWDDAAAPLAVDAARVKPVWDRLAARSEHMGYQRPAVATSDEPELCLAIGDRLIRAVVPDDEQIRKQWYFFELPADLAASSETLVGRLRSRSALPSDAEPWLDDRRRLGVMVESLTLFSTTGDAPQVIDMRDPTLQDGWWAPEAVLDWSARWTNGDAAVLITPGTRAVEVMVCGTLPYPVLLDRQTLRVVHL